jgi:hypothetical protein
LQERRRITFPSSSGPAYTSHGRRRSSPGLSRALSTLARMFPGYVGRTNAPLYSSKAERLVLPCHPLPPAYDFLNSSVEGAARREVNPEDVHRRRGSRRTKRGSTSTCRQGVYRDRQRGEGAISDPEDPHDTKRIHSFNRSPHRRCCCHQISTLSLEKWR